MQRCTQQKSQSLWTIHCLGHSCDFDYSLFFIVIVAVLCFMLRVIWHIHTDIVYAICNKHLWSKQYHYALGTLFTHENFFCSVKHWLYSVRLWDTASCKVRALYCSVSPGRGKQCSAPSPGKEIMFRYKEAKKKLSLRWTEDTDLPYVWTSESKSATSNRNRRENLMLLYFLLQLRKRTQLQAFLFAEFLGKINT